MLHQPHPAFSRCIFLHSCAHTHTLTNILRYTENCKYFCCCFENQIYCRLRCVCVCEQFVTSNVWSMTDWNSFIDRLNTFSLSLVFSPVLIFLPVFFSLVCKHFAVLVLGCGWCCPAAGLFIRGRERERVRLRQ